MARPEQRKRKRKALDHSQRMNHLKAKVLSKVAEQTWALNQRDKTITLLTEALRREPSNRTILMNLAAAYGRQRHYAKAEELLARLLDRGSQKASVYRQAAQTYALIDRPEKAMECYRRSLELAPDKLSTVPTLIELAGLYERRHRLAAAKAAVEEALQHDPSNEDALLQHAVLLRRSGEGAAGRGKAASAHHRHAPFHCHSVASLLRARPMARRSTAIQRCVSGIHRRQTLPSTACRAVLGESEAQLAKSREIVEMLDESWYARWKTASESDTKYRFAALTGHPRSGTTLVEQVLDSHDEVISCDEFDVVTQWIYLPIVRKFPYSYPVLSILDKVPPAVRQQARATYWKQTEAIFDKPIGSRMLLDKNPAMTLLLPVVNWAFPEMKMLIALRDPRDVILSCFMQKVRLNPISATGYRLPMPPNTTHSR